MLYFRSPIHNFFIYSNRINGSWDIVILSILIFLPPVYGPDYLFLLQIELLCDWNLRGSLNSMKEHWKWKLQCLIYNACYPIYLYMRVVTTESYKIENIFWSSVRKNLKKNTGYIDDTAVLLGYWMRFCVYRVLHSKILKRLRENTFIENNFVLVTPLVKMNITKYVDHKNPHLMMS